MKIQFTCQSQVPDNPSDASDSYGWEGDTVVTGLGTKGGENEQRRNTRRPLQEDWKSLLRTPTPKSLEFISDTRESSLHKAGRTFQSVPSSWPGTSRWASVVGDTVGALGQTSAAWEAEAAVVSMDR